MYNPIFRRGAQSRRERRNGGEYGSDQIEGGDREEVQGDGSTPLCICCVVFLMLSIVSVIVLGIVSTGWYLVTL